MDDLRELFIFALGAGFGLLCVVFWWLYHARSFLNVLLKIAAFIVHEKGKDNG